LPRLARRGVERGPANAPPHPPVGAELVDEQRMLGAVDVLEQQRWPAGLDRAVVDLRDLEVRIDLRVDANELTLALEARDPLAQVTRRGHRWSVYGRAPLPPLPPARGCGPGRGLPRMSRMRTAQREPRSRRGAAPTHPAAQPPAGLRPRPRADPRVRARRARQPWPRAVRRRRCGRNDRRADPPARATRARSAQQ